MVSILNMFFPKIPFKRGLCTSSQKLNDVTAEDFGLESRCSLSVFILQHGKFFRFGKISYVYRQIELNLSINACDSFGLSVELVCTLTALLTVVLD